MVSLNCKNAIITGAGRGIGRADAHALAKEGVNLGLILVTCFADKTTIFTDIIDFPLIYG